MLSACTSASAFNSSPPVDISRGDFIQLDNGQLRFYRDKTNSLTLEQVQSEAVQKEFVQLEKNLSFGYVPDTLWLSFVIDKEETQPSKWWLEVMPPYLDDIRLFHINPTSQITIDKSGDFVPLSQKQEAYRGNVFKLNLENGHHEFYLRLKTTSTMVAVVKLWQPEAFLKQVRISYFALGLYFSLILAVFLFTFVNYWVVKDRIFFYYLFYLLLNAIQWLGINGFVGEFAFPEQPLYANLTLGISLSLSATLAYIFYGKLFELKQYHRIIYFIYCSGALVSLATAIAVPFGLYQRFIPFVLIVAIIATVMSGWPLVRFWRSNKPWMRITVVAYCVYSALLCINILSSLSIIKFSEVTLYLGMLSNLAHILLLHFGLMFQYRDEMERAQQSEFDAQIAQLASDHEKKLRQEQTDFLAMMTHEIRTPIAVIESANESLRLLAEDDDRDAEKKNQRFNRISRSVKRLDTLLNMAIINTENEAWPFELKEVNMTELSHDTLELLDSENKVRVKIKSNQESLIVQADRQLLQFAMLNIIDNALKYSPDTSLATIKIEHSDYQNSVGVRWLVADEGPGIPDVMKHKIFDKYQRSNASSTKQGLGLGLYLVKNVIERHHGHIVVENLAKGGAQIGFWLPS